MAYFNLATLHSQSLSGHSGSDLTGRKAKAALTLVELLVVIAVIAVLAALLLLAFAGVKRKVRQANCVHNLGQLGLALQGFVTDNHMYPLEANVKYAGGGNPENLTGWGSALQNDLAKGDPVRTTYRWFEKGVWDCPSGQRPSDLPKSMGYVDYGYNSRGVFSLGRDHDSIGLGGHQGPATGGFVDTSAVRDSEIVNPADMMAIADAFMGNGTQIMDGGGFWRTPVIPPSWKFWPNNEQVARRVTTRHLGKANVAFCDGHVESQTLRSLFEDTSDAALSRWNRDHQPHRERLNQ